MSLSRQKVYSFMPQKVTLLNWSYSSGRASIFMLNMSDNKTIIGTEKH
ncbi:hypothetical protein [Providencia vermicola]